MKPSPLGVLRSHPGPIRPTLLPGGGQLSSPHSLPPPGPTWLCKQHCIGGLSVVPSRWHCQAPESQRARSQHHHKKRKKKKKKTPKAFSCLFHPNSAISFMSSHTLKTRITFLLITAHHSTGICRR